MILPSNRYDFRAAQKKPRGRKLAVVIAVVVALGTLTGIAAWQRDAILDFFTADANEERALHEFWDTLEYTELLDHASTILETDPLDASALIYAGFAHFYLSTESYTLEEKLPHIDRSIVLLRKALLKEHPPLQGSIEYVLGKAYHYKGRYYADLSISYLEKSLEHDYVGNDTYEYLGLAYSNLGYYEKSAENFKQAIEIEATDLRYLALAQAYINAAKIDDAESYLLRTINKTDNDLVEQKSRFLLGRIYFDSGQLPKAEDQYKSLLEVNPRSADAYYYLGEIYLKYGKSIEARAQWRNALDVDPNHYGARLRYYK